MRNGWYYNACSAPVAQLDRVSDYESEGREFESLPAHQVKSYIQSNLDVAFNFLFYIVSASCYSRHGAFFMSIQIHTIYPAIIKKESPVESQKLRIAAYCRVSKATPELLHSLEIQKLHFATIITENPNWTLYKVYSDVASGTRKTGRSGYCEMLRDAKRHRFDYIFVKSLSRFGRDTLEALSTIRRLKAMNIGLISEVERINTLKIDDATLSILFAVAQEESATKSENIKFGIHQRMREGKALLNHTRFLGYTKDAEGQLVIVPKEADIVRKIFSLYLEGNGVRKIKRYLEEHGIRTVTGKSEWSTSTIDRMLSNEKYMGTLLLQKTYTLDFLTGKQVKNRGELSMYMVENAHEAIIEKKVFEAVQAKKKKR